MEKALRKVRIIGTALVCCMIGGACQSEAPTETVAYREIEHQVEASELPLKWRISDVDPRFGLSADEVSQAIQKGIALWEAAAGKKLFDRDEVRGFPIKLIYDERQKELLENVRKNRAVQSEEDRMAAQRGMTEAAGSRFDLANQQLKSRIQSYEMRLNAYNQRVEQVNAAGGIQPGQEFEFEQERQALDAERAAISQAEQEVQRLGAEANAMADEFNRQVRQHNDEVRRQQQNAEPAKLVRLGECIIVEMQRGASKTTRIEGISVYAFQGLDHLAFILAHELGHALGLDHVEGDGSVMSEVEDGRITANRLKLSDRDLAELKRALD